jgi:hypothetical protein
MVQHTTRLRDTPGVVGHLNYGVQGGATRACMSSQTVDMLDDNGDYIYTVWYGNDGNYYFYIPNNKNADGDVCVIQENGDYGWTAGKYVAAGDTAKSMLLSCDSRASKKGGFRCSTVG